MTDGEARKLLATRLAQSAAEDPTALMLLQSLCGAAARPATPLAGIGVGPLAPLTEDLLGLASGSSRQRTVGIWEEDPRTGDFVRSQLHADVSRFFADVERIPRKGHRKRVVLLGESVARGFFFDPFYSPAQVLEAQLSLSGSPVDVVDLAQSNCDAWTLVAVASAATALEPDAIVVMAGNNWRTGRLSNESPEDAIAGSLLAMDGGLPRLLERQMRRLDNLAARVVDQLVAIADDAGAPIVFVVPEVNLADWSSLTHGGGVPVMSDSDTRCWAEASSRAALALTTGELQEAERSARDALALDGGTSSITVALLGRALLAQNKLEEAAVLFRSTRGLSLGSLDGTHVVPGVAACVADRIRGAASAGASVVDLPRLFAERYGGELPGRRLFLDYCHLTSQGIRLSMAATALEILRSLRLPAVTLDECFRESPSPSPEQEGWAHLLAAVHNSHWGRGTGAPRYHIEEALSHHADLRRTVIPLVYEAFRWACPPFLLSAFEELVANEIASVYLVGYSLHQRAFGAVSELELLTSIRAVCPELDDVPIDPEHSLGAVREINLLDPHWSHPTDPNRWFSRAYTVVYDLESRFLFECASAAELFLALTCRVPGGRDVGQLVIDINGAVISTFEIDGTWRSLRCSAGREVTRAGLNELTLRWPVVSRDDRRVALRRDFELQRPIDARTHFGHLHQLRVSLTP